MTFYDFILGFINDDTPLGSLANYILDDIHFPREEKTIKPFVHTCLITIETIS